jgi:hypothetical protein
MAAIRNKNMHREEQRRVEKKRAEQLQVHQQREGVPARRPRLGQGPGRAVASRPEARLRACPFRQEPFLHALPQPAFAADLVHARAPAPARTER